MECLDQEALNDLLIGSARDLGYLCPVMRPGDPSLPLQVGGGVHSPLTPPPPPSSVGDSYH